VTKASMHVLFGHMERIDRLLGGLARAALHIVPVRVRLRLCPR
jgi:hypothetical protein